MFTIPNILTLARLIAVPVFLIASFRGHYTLACGLLWLAEVLFRITAVATLASG